jgi:hypothetical protein
MKAKRSNIQVRGTTIGILSQQGGDYISLTDMVRNFDGAGALIEQWLKNKDTVLFLGVWERINNPDFNSLEFEGIKNEAGRNSFFLSAKKWIDLTGAKGLMASAGRYGGTYAHKDIAFEFGSWLSPEFKLYLIKEFQRLKDEENDRLKLDWNLQRTLAKINYRIHTDAIKETLIPPSITKAQATAVANQGAWVSRPRSSSSRNTALRSTEKTPSFLITDHCSHGTSPPHQPRKPQLRSHPPRAATARTPRHPQRHRHHPNEDPAFRQRREANQIVLLHSKLPPAMPVRASPVPASLALMPHSKINNRHSEISSSSRPLTSDLCPASSRLHPIILSSAFPWRPSRLGGSTLFH